MATEVRIVRKKVLFVCMGNCVRSQMAEALARHHASDIMVAESAGVHPLGFVDPTTQQALTEQGISFQGQFSKGLHNSHLITPDLIVNMSGISGDTLFRGSVFEDWRIHDPFGQGIETHRRILGDIRERILELADRLRAAEIESSSDGSSPSSAAGS
jgi:arsenate reductase (thioredoxin)